MLYYANVFIHPKYILILLHKFTLLEPNGLGKQPLVHIAKWKNPQDAYFCNIFTKKRKS